MEQFTIASSSYLIDYHPQTTYFRISTDNKQWESKNESAYVVLASGDRTYFHTAKCEAEYYETGIAKGVRAVYRHFVDNHNHQLSFLIYTFIGFDIGDDSLRFEIRIEKDKRNEIKEVYWPSAIDFDIEKNAGYTVLPFMHGCIIPSGWGQSIRQLNQGKLMNHDSSMPFYGQIDSGKGYITIYDTPYDAGYKINHVPNGETIISPYWRDSLGYFSYKRTLLLKFIDDCDYNKLCKIYRQYQREHGRLVTLRQKIDKNPAISRLIGTPVIHEGIAVNISKDSMYYNTEEPEKNHYFTAFETRARQLEELKKRGVERAYLHLDGWGINGYDNQHPDVLPPNEEAGGIEGMKKLSVTCSNLGYIFGIHDQYRDYYYDSRTFSFDHAVVKEDGTHPEFSYWYGGKHTLLCAQFAPNYVKRNYEEFKKLGIHIEGAYLDVFSIAELDQCLSEEHPMTRKECVEKRLECFEYLNANNIIPSSEEIVDSMLPAIALCHHAPFATTPLGASDNQPIGIPVPLFSLVYHDCIVVPWFGLDSKGDHGLPGKDWGFLRALLHGDTVYLDIEESQSVIERSRTVLELHKKVSLQEMVRHDFIDGDYKQQRTVFEDGTVVEVNFENDTYNIKHI